MCRLAQGKFFLFKGKAQNLQNHSETWKAVKFIPHIVKLKLLKYYNHLYVIVRDLSYRGVALCNYFTYITNMLNTQT